MESWANGWTLYLESSITSGQSSPDKFNPSIKPTWTGQQICIESKNWQLAWLVGKYLEWSGISYSVGVVFIDIFYGLKLDSRLKLPWSTQPNIYHWKPMPTGSWRFSFSLTHTHMHPLLWLVFLACGSYDVQFEGRTNQPMFEIWQSMVRQTKSAQWQVLSFYEGKINNFLGTPPFSFAHRALSNTIEMGEWVHFFKANKYC